MRIELPGLFDLQVNGFGGVDFNAPDLTAERVVEALERMRATGVTRCLPTLITSSFEEFAASARVLGRVPDPAIAGIHMEGPYLSPRTARAARIRARTSIAASVDDFQRRQDAADGRIALVTLAPEVPGALPLIEHLVASGVRVAIGHTAATPPADRRRDCRRRDAGDASRQRLRADAAAPSERHLGAARRRRVFASLIVDGHHLPPATVKAMVRAKGAAPDDSRHRRDRRRRLSAPARIRLATSTAELGEDGRVSLPGTPYLAGSSLTMDRAIANTVRFTGLPIDEVIPMASTHSRGAISARDAAGTVTADWDPVDRRRAATIRRVHIAA